MKDLKNLTKKECKNIFGGGKIAHFLGYFAHMLVDVFGHTAEMDAKYHNRKKRARIYLISRQRYSVYA